MFNIGAHALPEIVLDEQGRVFDKIQIACLIQSQSILEKILKSVLSSTKFIVPVADIDWKLVEKPIDNLCLNHMPAS